MMQLHQSSLIRKQLVLVGVGIAVVVFGLVFALGDFLPTGSDTPTKNTTIVKNQIPEEEKATLQQRLKEFETTLSGTPKDPAALEERPTDPDVFRVLGEVNYELQNYEGSIAAYRISEKVSKGIDLEVTRGLVNVYLAAKKPDDAVKFLLDTRERLNTRKTSTADSVTAETETNLDPIQVELLLGKAYSDWGHISDAVAVYDQLITAHTEDFRGYLAKGILLKENGSRGDAERMFIQARFFAPDKAKALVDRYSKL